MRGGGRDNSEPTSAAEGPGAPTLRGLGTNKHTPSRGGGSNTPMGRWPGELLLLRLRHCRRPILNIHSWTVWCSEFEAWTFGSWSYYEYRLRWIGGFALCTRCAGTTCTETEGSNLGRPCRGVVLAGAESRQRKLLRGELLWGFSSWPDERAEASQKRMVWPLEHTGSEWTVAQ